MDEVIRQSKMQGTGRHATASVFPTRVEADVFVADTIERCEPLVDRLEFSTVFNEEYGEWICHVSFFPKPANKL